MASAPTVAALHLWPSNHQTVKPMAEVGAGHWRRLPHDVDVRAGGGAGAPVHCSRGVCIVPQVPGPVSTCVGSFVSSSRSHRDGRWHHRDSIAYRSHHTNNKMRTKSHHVNSNHFFMRAANTANTISKIIFILKICLNKFTCIHVLARCASLPTLRSHFIQAPSQGMVPGRSS